MNRGLLSLWRLLRLLALPRGLLAAHASAYGQLASQELTHAWAAWQRRALLHGLGLFGVLGAALLAGVALMLWAVMPQVTMQAAWVLWLVPLVPAALALICFAAAQAAKGPPAFSAMRRQWAADLALLRGSRAPSGASGQSGVASRRTAG